MRQLNAEIADHVFACAHTGALLLTSSLGLQRTPHCVISSSYNIPKSRKNVLLRDKNATTRQV